MEQKQKDQFVVAYIRDFSNTEATISYAQALSSILKKGIIILYISGEDAALDILEAEKRLKVLKESIQSEYMVSYMAISGDSKTIISALPEKMGAVCFIASLSKHEKKLKDIRKLLHLFSESRVAYCIVKESLQNVENLKKIAFAVDFERQSKEKVLWASYFGRFFQSQIYCLYYAYQDEFLRKRLQDNQMFVSKMLSAFQIQVFFEELKTRRKWKLEQEAFKYAEMNNAGLFISITKEGKDIWEYFSGTPEEKLLLNLNNVPLMLLNPRKDLYVLCD